eukprot:gnl/TRDRNA2_/TRDRNA2_131755_c0_seq4.p1 gnl/TRDRNA2_/TRDRNA2_131755_c0~~gnl/TRDRNA2_/TRDRNA2_131755_c0_seq4.p1  ORF type:complete len:119 (-),score=24.38 gnl/TRDRNA2_/TRDRNA2_131755_c0_seq4:67-423(-)
MAMRSVTLLLLVVSTLAASPNFRSSFIEVNDLPHQKAESECRKSCHFDGDSHCWTNCETDMYECIKKDKTKDESVYEACKAKVLHTCDICGHYGPEHAQSPAAAQPPAPAQPGLPNGR